MQHLEGRKRQSERLYRDTLQPALRAEKAKYAAQRRQRSPSRGRGQEPAQGGPGLRVHLGESLDHMLERLRRQVREQDQVRTRISV